jgi:phosphonate metabolism protein PhnN/1,5-bisphosphokinase (PRPP-forming)
MRMKEKVWVAIVGPSGAGKDTLLAALRESRAEDPRLHFARRAITRPQGGVEDHLPLTEAEFAARRFALSWHAHGLAYGIPEEEAPADRVVVMSLSRLALAAAASQARLLVAEVTAPPALLAARLAARGREGAAAIAARLAREAPLPEGLEIRRIVNDGGIAEGAARLASAVDEACGWAGFPPYAAPPGGSAAR